MTRKKNDSLKPLQKIEASVTEILIAGDDALKPYIQTFHYEPENIALASLGSVLGIFEIEDQSEESAYIVNFLASVVKKEYFAQPKRAAIESLEATLHKVNLALAELIKQDNTAWLGKLNATLCVIEKNNVHFSVSGKAKMLLIRNEALSDISAGLAEESEHHPLKTFVEVSSGRLIAGDKLILTTPGLFDIFSPEEVRKNAVRLSNEKFSQFIRTALVNRLLFGSTIIMDISEAIVQKPILKKTAPTEEQKEIPNAFSQSAFAHEKATEKTASVAATSPAEELKPAQESEYTDSKTGHIYVQGDIAEVPEDERWAHIQEMAEEFFETASEHSKRFFNQSVRNIRSWISEAKYKIQEQQEAAKLKRAAKEAFASKQTEQAEESLEEESIQASFKDVSWNTLTIYARKLFASLPRFSSIRDEFLKLSPKQKKYAIAALFSIFVVPFLIIKFQDEPKASSTPIEEKSPIVAPKPLSQDKNIRMVSSVQSLLNNNALVATVTLKGAAFAITKNSVIAFKDTQSTQSFALPTSFGATITKATVMGDLNTIFLLTDTGKIISFTPSNHAFSENTISLPPVENITDIATYLTYLYVLDSKDSTIYRYPRADGGFGERSAWLKETVPVKVSDTMAISEDLYLSQGDQLLAFNRGKKDSVAFEQSATPIVFSRVFTQSDAQSLYVIDTVNGRLVQFDKSGAITTQYAHDKMKGAISITVDEQNKKAYFTTPSEVFSIDLN